MAVAEIERVAGDLSGEQRLRVRQACERWIRWGYERGLVRSADVARLIEAMREEQAVIARMRRGPK